MGRLRDVISGSQRAILDPENKQRDSSRSGGLHTHSRVHSSRAGVKNRLHNPEQGCGVGEPPSRLGLGGGVPVEQGMGVELLGARCSRWLNRAEKPWSVREDGVALEGSQRWRGSNACYKLRTDFAIALPWHFATILARD